MKYTKYIFIVLVSCFQVLTAQVNFIPNHSFEIDTSCNLNGGGINLGYAPPWDTPTNGSSDVFNICSITSNYNSIPDNTFGFQHPHFGNGYAGIMLYTSSNDREYLQVELDSLLLPQHNYCVSFYVSLANKGKYACNNLGLYFSNTHTYISAFQGILNFIPQINDTVIVSDTLNWTLISGQYTALGGEHYIIIGNFYANALTDTIHMNGIGNEAYYYIDDVDVHCCSCSEQGVKEEGNSEGISVYPNPATKELTIELKNIKAKSIKVINMLGEVVINNEKAGVGKMEVDVGNLAKGIYFVVVEGELGILRRKFVKE